MIAQSYITLQIFLDNFRHILKALVANRAVHGTTITVHVYLDTVDMSKLGGLLVGDVANFLTWRSAGFLLTNANLAKRLEDQIYSL